MFSNFRRVLNLNVCILLGISPASDENWSMPTFQNTLSIPSSKAGCEDGTDRVFRNVGILQFSSDAGEIPKRIHTFRINIQLTCSGVSGDFLAHLYV